MKMKIDICLPTYYDTFYGNDNGDNPQATKILGEKFKKITLKGIIVTNSQVTIPYFQKGYIKAYVPNDIVKELNSYLNRYNNIVSFYPPLNEKNTGVKGLYVTYDGDEKLNQLIEFTYGEPFSQIGFTDTSSIIQIKRWLNKKLNKIINSNHYSDLTIINPCYDDVEYVIDVLLDAINDL